MDTIRDRSRLARYVLQIPAFAVADMLPGQLAIYMQYVYRCGQAGGAWSGGLADVAKGAGMSVNTARTGRQWLIDNGWLTVANQGPRGALEIEIADRWGDALAASGLGSIPAEVNQIRSDQIKSDQIKSDQVVGDGDQIKSDHVKSDQIKSDQVPTSGDQIKSDQVAGDSSHFLPRSSSRSIDPLSIEIPKTTTTTTGAGGSVAWAAVDSLSEEERAAYDALSEEERAAYDALHDAGLNGSSASLVRSYGVKHCINHAAAYLADSEHNPSLRPAVLLWRIHNKDAPAVGRLPGDWRHWWARYASRAGLMVAGDPVIPADPVDAGPLEDDDLDLLAGMLPELLDIVRAMESGGTLGRSECLHWFGSASGRLEDGGATLRILHPDGAKLHFLRDRLGNRIRLCRPAGVDVIKFGEGEGVAV